MDDLEQKFRTELVWNRVRPESDRVKKELVLVWGGHIHGIVEQFESAPEVWYGTWPTGRTGAMRSPASAREGVVRGCLARIRSPRECPTEGGDLLRPRSGPK